MNVSSVLDGAADLIERDGRLVQSMNVVRNRMLIDMLRRWPAHIGFDRSTYESNRNGHCFRCTLGQAVWEPEFILLGLNASDSAYTLDRVQGHLLAQVGERVRPFFGWSHDQYAAVAFAWSDKDHGSSTRDYGTPEMLAAYLERELLQNVVMEASPVRVVAETQDALPESVRS